MSNVKTGSVDRGPDVPDYGAKPMGDDHGTPGHQERVMTDEEKHEKALEDTFPTSDPVPASRIDGPND